MKLYAILRNERGGKKQTSDDTRIQVELNYKNSFLGTLALYPIIDEQGKDTGYRITWNNDVIAEDENIKGKKKKDE